MLLLSPRAVNPSSVKAISRKAHELNETALSYTFYWCSTFYSLSLSANVPNVVGKQLLLFTYTLKLLSRLSVELMFLDCQVFKNVFVRQIVNH